MKSACRIIMLCIFFSIFSTSIAAAEGYYVWNGSSMAHEKYGDPEKATNIEEWQIWLFPKGLPTAPIPDLRWGLITGKTAASVNKQLKNSQKFEKEYERFFGTDWGKDTFFNPLGPVAVVKKERSEDVHEKILGVIDQTREVFGIHEDLSSILSTELEEKTFEGTGSVLKEYAENFEDIFALQSKLRKTLDQIWLPYDYTLAYLDDFSKELADLKTKTNSVKSRMGLKQRMTFAGDWTWGDSKLKFSDNKGKIGVSGGEFRIERVEGNRIRGKMTIYSPDGDSFCRETVNFELTLSKDGKTMHGWHENVIFKDFEPDISTYDDGQGHRTTVGRIRLGCDKEKSGRKEMTVTRAK